jgi:putative Mg2+ transporter-C (MgtC) family protein
MPYTEMLLRIGTAMILGGLIGLERQRLDRPAGLRTHLMAALAAVTFMLVSTHFAFFQGYQPGGLVRVDPSRIASGIVMGLGFLGAGTIARSGRNIIGLTTAASLWLVTALGMAAGAGMFVLAWTSGALSLFVLLGLRVLEGRSKKTISRRVVVVLDDGGAGRSEVLDRARASGAAVRRAGFDRDAHAARTTVRLVVGLDDESRVEPLLQRLEALPGVRRVAIAPDRSVEGE